MKVYVIVAGGGKSERMRLSKKQSKLFLKLLGKPIIFYTLDAFEKARKVDAVLVSAPKRNLDEMRHLVRRFQFAKVVDIVEGGDMRQDSVYNAFLSLPCDNFSENDIVLIHDGARPFIQPRSIDVMVILSRKYGAIAPFTKPTDTIKTFNGSFFGKTLYRNSLAQVQTPQAFSASMIWQAHKKAKRARFYSTDDASIVEKFFPKQKIFGFELGYPNPKITIPEDLKFATTLIPTLL